MSAPAYKQGKRETTRRQKQAGFAHQVAEGERLAALAAYRRLTSLPDGVKTLKAKLLVHTKTDWRAWKLLTTPSTLAHRDALWP